jgi:predicted metalloprotease with PDZ domain
VMLGPTPAKVTVRVVRLRHDAVDFGADVRAEPDGARIVKVTKIAARSWLRAGDLVRAVDGIALAGLTRRSMAALAFFFPRDATPRWEVIRDGKTLTIEARHQ